VRVEEEVRGVGGKGASTKTMEEQCPKEDTGTKQKKQKERKLDQKREKRDRGVFRGNLLTDFKFKE